MSAPLALLLLDIAGQKIQPSPNMLERLLLDSLQRFSPGTIAPETEGGRIVAEGPPERIVQVPESYTGQYLKSHLAPAIPSVVEQKIA